MNEKGGNRATVGKLVVPNQDTGTGVPVECSVPFHKKEFGLIILPLCGPIGSVLIHHVCGMHCRQIKKGNPLDSPQGSESYGLFVGLIWCSQIIIKHHTCQIT